MDIPFQSKLSPVQHSSSPVRMPCDLTLTIQEKTNEPKVKSTKMCNHSECRKKIGLSDMPCKCGLKFCASHKFYTDHSCTHNYRKETDSILQKQLVKCNGTKLAERIEEC
jgi:hypothetical protein